jgi:hypothetical protein
MGTEDNIIVDNTAAVVVLLLHCDEVITVFSIHDAPESKSTKEAIPSHGP